MKKLIENIISIGVSDHHVHNDDLIRFLNIMSILSFSGGVNVACTAFFYTDDYPYIILAFIAGICYFPILILHYFFFIKEAKYYYALIVPLWFMFGIITIGGNFGQAIATATNIIVINLLFSSNQNNKWMLILYNALIYTVSTLYISFYEPIFGVRDYHFDELFVFAVCVCWISAISYIYESITKMYIKSLQQKNEKLEQKTNELERFNYIASHDLKSPLTNILNFLSLVKKQIDQEKYDHLTQYLNYAESGTYQMKELIEGVLEISNLSKEQSKSSYKNVDLNISLQKAIDNIQQEVASKNAHIKIKNDLPNYSCKEADFIIVFQNLIQNGIKYNKSTKPKIIISCVVKDAEILIQFKDNGIGIDKQHHTHIFEYFKRLHNTSEYKGTGLGLGICKKIIDKYEGQIKVDSIVGSYTSFTIILPLVKKVQTSEDQLQNENLASREEALEMI